jgi:hypothetical protein
LLTSSASSPAVEPELQTPGQNTDIDMEVSGTPVPSQNKTADQKPKRLRKDKEIFYFVTVYYKRGEWGIQFYGTLREGLLEFVEIYCDSLAERDRLISLDDEELLNRMLIMGTNSNRHVGEACQLI